MREDERLRALLGQAAAAWEPLSEYFRRAGEAGIDLALALDTLPWDGASPLVVEAAGDPWDEWYGGDPIDALIDHCGVDGAREIVGRSRHATADVDARERARAARVRALRAIELGDAAEIALAVRDEALPARDRESVVGRWVAATPLATLLGAGLAPELVDAVRARVRRATPLETLELLLAEDREPALVAEALERFWDVDLEHDDPALAVASAHARLLRDAGRSVRAAIPYAAAHLAPETWIPVLRNRGLDATAIALFLTEQSMPWSILEIARALAASGYGDAEVMRALLENGVRSSSALVLLCDEGWSVGRMAGTLVARGALASDIREHLRTLGVPDPAIADALAPHLPPDVVALIVPQ